MKPIHAILAALAACLLVSTLAFAAGEPEAKRRLEIKIAADDDVVKIEADDMEIGETRQSFTESGKEVLVTRTEDGFQLEVDGKEIDVDLPHAGDHGDGHHAMFNMTGDEARKVVIHKFHGEGGDDHGYHYVHAGGGEDVDLVIERFSAADRLAESGVLDDLDEAKRQEILDALREMEPQQIHKQVRVKIHEEHDGDE